jgi:hypothetical protein
MKALSVNHDAFAVVEHLHGLVNKVHRDLMDVNVGADDAHCGANWMPTLSDV